MSPLSVGTLATIASMARQHHEALDRLRAEAAGFTDEPYLVTVTTELRPHCGVVTVDWDGPDSRLVVHAASSWARSEASGHRRVTLLWPPPMPGGYSLIVDGLASTLKHEGDEILVAVAPTRAVLHRPGRAAVAGSACGSDCVQILSS